MAHINGEGKLKLKKGSSSIFFINEKNVLDIFDYLVDYYLEWPSGSHDGNEVETLSC